MTNPPSGSLTDFNLFSGEPQHDNFARLKDHVPTARLAPAQKTFSWPQGQAAIFPATYDYEGQTRSSETFFTETDTAGLLVLKDGLVRIERYALSGGPAVPWISMSVAKSFISALVGIAVSEGHIASIEDPISAYIRVDPGSAYDGVAIRNVLQMSSGARWNEDYADPNSDVHRLAAAMVGAISHDDFIAGMVRETEPGTVCRYNSGDTQALGHLLVKATGRSITDYMQDKLFEPLGMVDPGYWLIDRTGMEMAYAGLNLTARDYAKLGELYRLGGKWNGQQIVPADWVKASVRWDAPHLLPGCPILSDHTLPFGYGYQWWLPDGTDGEFSAIGIYNQFVYVDPSRGVVIVKQSANRAYGTTMDEATNREDETIAFLRGIARQLV
jgi:CubicO group peptidase (beta-lactamase class C family)